jgi:hypothetical protein
MSGRLQAAIAGHGLQRRWLDGRGGEQVRGGLAPLAERLQQERSPTKKPPPMAGAERSDGSNDPTIKRCGRP